MTHSPHLGKSENDHPGGRCEGAGVCTWYVSWRVVVTVKVLDSIGGVVELFHQRMGKGKVKTVLVKVVMAVWTMVSG